MAQNSSSAKNLGPSTKALKLPQIFVEDSSHYDLIYHEVVRWLEMERGYPFERLQKLSTLCKRTDLPEKGLILINIQTKEDLLRLDHAFNRFSNRESLWNLQFIVLCRVNHPQVWRYLRERGFLAISPELTSLRAIKLRIDRQLRILELAMKRQLPEFIKGLQKQISQMPTFKVSWQPSLFVENDLWLIPTERFAYRANDKWVITLWGPTGKSGTWQELHAPKEVQQKEERKISLTGKDTWWRWVPKEGGVFAKQEAPPVRAQRLEAQKKGRETWFFLGSRPRFQDGRWVFVGAKAELVFLDQFNTRHIKFRGAALDQLEVATNSPRTVSFVEAQAAPLLKGPSVTPTPFADLIGTSARGANIFQAIEDLNTIFDVLTEACHKKTPVFLWLKHRKLQIKARIEIIDGEILKIALQTDDALLFHGFIEAARNEAKPEILGNFKTPKGSIFILIDHFDPHPISTRWTVVLKRVVFQVQRRAGTRIPVKSGMPVSAKFGGIPILLRDLSAGGLGAVLLNADENTFKSEQIYPLILQVGDRTLQVSGEIRWKSFARTENQTVGQLNFGIRFVGLHGDDQTILSLFVFENLDGQD